MDEIDLPRRKEQTGLEVLSKTEERFDHLRRRAGLYAAPLAFGIVLWLTRDRLTPGGNYLSAVLACVLVLWMTETLPLPVTSMLGASLCIVFGVADARKVFAPFADPIIFLFIGGFIVARAMTLHHLDRRFCTCHSFSSLGWRESGQDIGCFWNGNSNNFNVGLQLSCYSYDDANCYGDSSCPPGYTSAGS